MVQTHKRLDDAIHVARVANVFEANCWSQIHAELCEILIIFAIKCSLTSIIVERLIVGPAFSCAIDNLVTNATNSQRFFVLNALLTVSFDLMDR